MICEECNHCVKGFFKDNPEGYTCVDGKDITPINNRANDCSRYLPGDDPSLNWFDLNLMSDSAYYGELKPPTLYMMVGLPGCGKTTIANRIIESDPTVVHISSDAIRGRLWGDENCQNNPAEVFRVMNEETLSILNAGFSVVYDATNITRKDRRGILEQLPSWVRKECLICWAPFDVCVERDKLRDRSVGNHVISRMLRRFEAPYYDEGFDRIQVLISDVHYSMTQYYTDLISATNIPHDNPHHSANVMEHCRLCGVGLIDSNVPDVVMIAGFLHDIGKPYCKTFVNKKGETTETAHYYDHQAVGAWLSYGIEGHSPTLAWLISTHMAPYINKKYYEGLPPLWKRWIDELHRADVEAH